MKLLALFVGLLVCNEIFSQEIKDTLFLSNGTTVIGKIKKIRLGMVTFDPDDANDINVQLRKIKTITATWRVFRIETIDQHVYFGILIPTDEPQSILIETNSGTFSMKTESISLLYPFDKSVWQRFSGSVGIGFNYTKSSDFGRLNTNGTLKYAAKNLEMNFSASGIYTVTDSSFTHDREDMNLMANYYYVRNWFATAFIAFQKNLELGLDRRFQEGIGIGNKFITSKSFYSWARTGFVFNQEKNTENVSTGTLVETFGQFELNFFHYAKRKFNMTVTQTIYYNLSQKNRFRTDGDINFTWEVFKDFDLSLEVYNSFDSKPPAAGSEKFDYGTVFGINYIFN